MKLFCITQDHETVEHTLFDSEQQLDQIMGCCLANGEYKTFQDWLKDPFVKTKPFLEI